MRFLVRILIASILGLGVSYVSHRWRERGKSTSPVNIARDRENSLEGKSQVLDRSQGKAPPDQNTLTKVDGEKKEPEKIWMTGKMWLGRKVQVTLSDGRTLTERDGLIKRVERNFVELETGEKFWMYTPKPRVASAKSAGAGGESPPDRQRAEAAAEAIAEPSGRGATVGGNVEVESAPAPVSDSTPVASVPVSRGQTFRQSPRTAAPVINEGKLLTGSRGVTKSPKLGR